MDRHAKHVMTGEMPHCCLLQVVGTPCRLYTNSQRLQEIIAEFFYNPILFGEAASPVMTLRFYVQEDDDEDAGRSLESVPRFSHFRGFGPFVFATYDHRNKVSFNLCDREVIGIFSSTALRKEELWRRTILPVLVGIMSSSLRTVALHSACLVYKGKGLLLSGYSGVGKSTLTAALARKGLSLLSDDWTYLSYDGGGCNAWGLPIPIKLLPDAVRFFPELEKYLPTSSLNGETAYEIDPEVLFNCSRTLHCKPRCFFLLERSELSYTNFEPIEIEEVVPYFASGLEELPEMIAHLRQPQIDLIRRLESCSLYRLRFHGSPDDVANEVLEFCEKILTEGVSRCV